MKKGQLLRLIHGRRDTTGTDIPVITVNPQWLSTTPQAGETISYTPGLWSNFPNSYETTVDQSDDGSTGWTATVVTTTTFVPGSGMVGKYLRPKVRASNSSGTSSYAYGDVIGPIAAAASGAGGTDYPFSPKLAPVTLYRTPMVPQNDEVIDLQTEVALPYSPTVTSWTLGGTHASYFDYADGKLVFNPATRASIPKNATLSITIAGSNTFGAASAVVVSVFVPSDANCRFCDYDSGLDSRNGTTPALSWKQIPRSLGFTGTQVTLGANVVVFFKGGVHHRYYLLAASNGQAMAHTGTAGNPFIMSGTGWGSAPAIMDGSDPISDWSPVTQAEMNDNPNWASIEKAPLAALGGSILYDQMLLVGDDLHYPAQWPKPANRQLFEGPDDVTEQQGMRRVAISTNPAVVPRMSRTGTTLTIVDPWLQTVIGNRSIEGMRGNYWAINNFITSTQEVLSWDYATSTITVTAPQALRAGAPVGAYSLTHDKMQIEAPGQYALSGDRTTIYRWKTNDGVASIAKRQRCYQPNGYQVFTGFIGQMFTTAGNTSAGGFFINHGISADLGSFHCYNVLMRYNRSEIGNGVVHGSGANSWGDVKIERTTLRENPKSSGYRMPNEFNGVFQHNYIDSYGISQTALWIGKSNGAIVYRNVFRNLSTVHGNGYSPYTPSTAEPPVENKNVHFYENFFDGVVRPITTSIGFADLARNNLYERNIMLGAKTGYIGLWSGEPDSTFRNNIIMAIPGFEADYAMLLGAGERVLVEENVIAGVVEGTTSPLDQRAYTVQNNLLTVDRLPINDGPDRLVAGNVVSTETTGFVWDRTITEEMAEVLKPGPIGVFWEIAA